MTASVFPGRFAGKAAVVTGAAQGIGHEVALRLSREGADVVIADMAEGLANEAVATIVSEGGRAVAAVGDLGTLAGAEAAMAAAIDSFGRLDVLVNNVGGTIWAKPFWHYTEEEIRAEVERSFWPVLWCSRAVIEPMRAGGGGAIVNIGSNAAADAVYRIPYSAAKGAVLSLTRCLAVELAPLGIRVNCMSPGGTLAPDRKTPRETRPFSEQEREWWGQFSRLVGQEELIARRATVAEQAAVIAFLASDESAHMTGEVIETGRRGIRID
ncbi:MAG TPA: SDR family NAD(P)-dependent oxidoreductase, partial [Novosphingobium sp.]|nr:SDR family NAD(P)-dependent oxidoreductase [Novosphingobium sp.]